MCLETHFQYELSTDLIINLGPYGQLGAVLKKKFGADYEQLLRAFFSMFSFAKK